ncbi:unnamed protein product, partial [Rhizoctonia solani]
VDAVGRKGVKNQFLASEESVPAPPLRRFDETVEVDRMDSCEGDTLRCEMPDRVGVENVVSTVGNVNAGNGSGECPLKLGASMRTRLVDTLVDARLRFGFRTFLNGSMGIGWASRLRAPSRAHSFHCFQVECESGDGDDGRRGGNEVLC